MKSQIGHSTTKVDLGVKLVFEKKLVIDGDDEKKLVERADALPTFKVFLHSIHYLYLLLSFLLPALTPYTLQHIFTGGQVDKAQGIHKGDTLVMITTSNGKTADLRRWLRPARSHPNHSKPPPRNTSRVVSHLGNSTFEINSCTPSHQYRSAS